MMTKRLSGPVVFLALTGGLISAAGAQATRPSAATRPTTQLTAAPKNPAELLTLQQQVKAVVKRVEPSVVGLRVGNGQGSGVIISEDGTILTAGHVSGAPGRDCVVILPDGKTYKGKTLGNNAQIDSGMVKITDPGPNKGKWPAVELGKSADLVKGQWVITMGHPGGFRNGRTPPVRLGRVLDNRPDNFIRTDCTLVGGDSGGPLFDLQGRVVGIHSRIGAAIADNMHVPADTYAQTWERLAKGEAFGGLQELAQAFRPRAGSPWMGVEFDQESEDCRIAEVLKDGPAAKAGLLAGDTIVRLANEKVNNFGELVMGVQRRKVGDSVAVEVRRGKETVTLNVTLGRRPDNL